VQRVPSGVVQPTGCDHLSDDGVFVLECRVPSAHARPGRQFVDAERIDVDQVVLDVCSYDPIPQILDENHVRIGADGIGFSPIRLRLAHPPEFDLMARIAGLRLRERWGGWGGEPLHRGQLAPHQRLRASASLTGRPPDPTYNAGVRLIGLSVR
jgi:hypothetical protein